MSIGERIKQCRLENGLSVDELAAKIGKNRATIYRYENDEIDNLPTSVIGDLADCFDISPAFLMGWEDTHPEPIQKKESSIWSNNFRQSLVEVLLTVDPTDAKDACADLNKLQDIAYGSGQLSLEECCEVCSEIGESLDQMTHFIDETLIPKNEDERTAKLVELFNRLTPDRQDLILAQLEAIASR